MKVRAAFWLSAPCSMPELREYRSVAAALADFALLKYDANRWGGEPVGEIVFDDCDELYAVVSVGPRGGTIVDRC